MIICYARNVNALEIRYLHFLQVGTSPLSKLSTPSCKIQEGVRELKEEWIMSGKLVGEVNHFYNRIGVAVIDLSDSLQLGDQVHFLGRSTDFRQEVQSMQIEHESISEAGKGQEIAMKVERRVRNHDKVYKLSDDE
jgi:putative protease